MFKILVLSDSHGNVSAMELAVRQQTPDMMIFLGDCVPDFRELTRIFPKIDALCVRGNCDARSSAPETMFTELCGKRIMLTHGHAYGVKLGLLRLSLAAKAEGCDAVLFGHTHSKYIGTHGGVLLFNPGAAAVGSFGILKIENDVLTAVDPDR